MRYGSLFIALSASLPWLAVVVGGAGLALLWPAPSFALVGVAYLARQPTLLGKRVDGALAWWSWLLFAPGARCTRSAAATKTHGTRCHEPRC